MNTYKVRYQPGIGYQVYKDETVVATYDDRDEANDRCDELNQEVGDE